MALKITLVRSPIGYNKRQKRTVEALGLRRLNHSVIKPDNPAIRGMVRKISHLVSVEEVADEPVAQEATAQEATSDVSA
ncbi:MAG: 50S ribosomal protein L30 [bacterium]|nr:50S ribosomal protein L30 [bacterium]MCS7308905.1 50S ribosomal protein L30 [Armatimonadota bacterium]MDW8103542.1 50S ribosomal protein L30 [Armatimonadota bacterium]